MEDKGPLFILNYEWVKWNPFYNMEAATMKVNAEKMEEGQLRTIKGLQNLRFKKTRIDELFSVSKCS